MFKRKILILLTNLLFSVITLGIFILLAWGLRALTFNLKPEYKAIKIMMQLIIYFMVSALAITFVYFWFDKLYRFIRYLMLAKSISLAKADFKTFKKAEKWAVALGWWIPRKYRGPIVGDILEDCHEMRDKSCGEWRIRVQVIWQWAFAVLTLVPAAFFGGIWRIFSPPK